MKSESCLFPGVSRQAIPLWSALEHDPAVIYVLDNDLRIIYCNAAWDRFAKNNGGSASVYRRNQLGSCVLDAIPRPLKPFFRDAYSKVLATGEAWAHEYECSSPTEFRRFQMNVQPAAQGGGLLVVNSLHEERPIAAAELAGLPAVAKTYANPHGLITMCSHCRRTARADGSDVWDWVPDYLNRMPKSISHGLCAVCMALYYPNLD